MGLRGRLHGLWDCVKSRRRQFIGKVRAKRLISRDQVKLLVHKALWRISSGKPLPLLPKITLVTPVFNGETHISETLKSVLSQEYPALEYIVVDGGSTDKTLDIVRRYEACTDFSQRISLVISEPDQGMYDAIAKGFERASGEIFCYLNADDLLEAGGLNSVGRFFSERPDAGAIFHDDTILIAGWKFPNVCQPQRVRTSNLLNGHILFQDGVFFRRETYEAVGGLRRNLRYAGDYDLWLRMSARTRFIKRPGHVSCFRIRSGQLSENMSPYKREMELSRRDFLMHFGALQKFKWQVASRLNQIFSALSSVNKIRLHFPIDFPNLPPPAAIGVFGNSATGPRSPVDGAPAERLLFSTTDNRFGGRELNHIYLDTRNETAITYPPLEFQILDALYKKNYSSPPATMDTVTGPSPYRGFDGRRFWEKYLLRLPTEKMGGLFQISWLDKTLVELTAVLRAARIDTNLPLRFLDTGCFEGKLLDQIAEKKPWIAAGLEPNEAAVSIAREKAHRVWHGHAENAVEIIPEGQQFDVIFMGQSIEHVDDPIRVLRRLRLLLAPGGALILSTPNLRSREIDWFGPTWAHWHPPYHRYIFSRKGLHALACKVGLQLVSFRSFSHPYWTAMSIALNRHGLGGSVSNAIQFDSAICNLAMRISFWESLIFNPIGKGDYCYVVMMDGSDD